MKADKFIKLMRTIISEEVRRVVREELKLTLIEQRNAGSVVDSYVPGSVTNKYRNLLDDEFEATRSTKSNIKFSSGNPMNSLLAETAEQMRTDPASKAFFEGL